MDEINILTGSRLSPDEMREFSARNSGRNKMDDVLLSEELFQKTLSLLAPWRQQVAEDKNFAAGAQWDKDKEMVIKARGQTPLIIDCVSPAIEQAVALLTSNHPGFTATGSDDSDRHKARFFADLVNFILYKNQFPQLIKQVIRDYYVSSIGWLSMGWDPMRAHGRGDIGMRYLDPLTVFPDISAREFFFQDAPHLMVGTVRTFEQLTFLMPELLPLLGSAEQAVDDLTPSSKKISLTLSALSERPRDNFKRKYLEIDRYSKMRVEKKLIFKPDTGFERMVNPEELDKVMESPAFIRTGKSGAQQFVDPASVRDAKKAIEQFSDTFHIAQDQQGGLAYEAGEETSHSNPNTMPVPNSTTTLQPTTWGALASEGVLEVKPIIVSRVLRTYSIGGTLVYRSLKEIEDYPLIPLVNNFDSSVAPVSDIRRVKGLQQYINEIHTDIAIHTEASANIKIAYPEGNYNEKELDKKWRSPGVTFIPFSPELGMGLQPLYPPPLPNELYKSIADAKGDIERILGIYAMMQGSPADAPSTYKGTVALDEYGQRRIRSKREDIEEFISQVGRVAIQHMQAYYTDERTFRIVRPNKQEFTLAVNPSVFGEDVSKGMEFVINDITIGEYDIRVIPGSMLPSNRWALAEYYMELLKLGAIDLEEFLKKTEVADAEEVLARMDDRKQMRQMIEQQQAQIKQLSGDLQTAQRESVSDRKRVEVMSLEKELNKMKVQAQAATEMFIKGLQDDLRAGRAAKKEKGRSK